MFTTIGKYCTPAQLYVFFAAISLLLGFLINFKFVTLLVNSFFVLIWAWFLDWMCRKGVGVISWALVILPFIFFAASFCLALDAKDSSKKEGMGSKTNKSGSAQ